MKYYNDLRDYHNQKFIKENLKDFIYSSILIMCSNNIKIGYPIIQILYNLNILEIYIINTNRNKKIYDKLEIRKKSIQRNSLYNEILNNIVLYIKENNITNPINIMKLLHKVIFNGYLSYNKKFKNINPNEKNLIDSPYQVILGKGVCRNINILTTDIFKKLNYEATDVFCTIYNKDNMIRHIITKVKYNNNFYYLDTQNNRVLDLKNNIFVMDNIYTYVPVDIKNKTYDKEDILFLINYYKNKRSINDILILVGTQEQNKKISQIEKINTTNSNQIYDKNKKLYKKFRKTYL